MKKLPFAKGEAKSFEDKFNIKAIKNFSANQVIYNLVKSKNYNKIDEHVDNTDLKPFILNRLLNGDKRFYKQTSAMARCYNMPLRNVLQFYYYTLPKVQNFKIDYNNVKDKNYSQTINLISKIFNYNIETSIEVYKLLTQDQINELYEVEIQNG